MDFDDALRVLVAQIPRGHVGRCGDLAVALGDPAAARAVRKVVETRGRRWPGSVRVVTAEGRTVVSGASVDRPRFTDFRGGGLLARLRREQVRLASRNVTEDRPGDPDTVTGVDVSYGGDRAFAAAATWDFEVEAFVDRSRAAVPEPFPYVPGFLALREFPPASAALRRLYRRPDVVLVDGHGLLHPARFGFASYLGVRLGIPTIGVAKSPLTPEARGVAPQIGHAVPILVRGEVHGYCWRPSRAKPVYVSPGHAVSAARALAIARRCASGRVPRPLHEAHRCATEFKRIEIKRGK